MQGKVYYCYRSALKRSAHSFLNNLQQVVFSNEELMNASSISYSVSPKYLTDR